MYNGRSYLVVLILTLISTIATAQLTYNELRIDYDSAWTYKNLQMVPIRFKPQGEGVPKPLSIPRPMSLAEAMQRHKIKVQEMQYEKGADVNWLQVTNNSKNEIMIQSGEVLDGGKQDRMVGETKFIAPGTTDYIHVYCVEKRRWDDKPKDFRHRGVVNSDVRKAMDKTSRQSEVWREIDKQFKAQDKTSETFSYLELLNAASFADTGYIRYFTRKYVESDSNFAGFIFITGDKIMSAELFATSGLLEVSFNNVLSSYVQSVISHGAPPKVPVPQMKTFLDKFMKNEEDQKKYVTAHGQIYKTAQKVIHIVAYPD